MADSESWLRLTPVEEAYPHIWRPLCASARDLWSEKERAPSEATEGANPANQVSNRKRGERFSKHGEFEIHTVPSTKPSRKTTRAAKQLRATIHHTYRLWSRMSTLRQKIRSTEPNDAAAEYNGVRFFWSWCRCRS